MPDIAMQDCSTVQAVPYPYVDFDFGLQVEGFNKQYCPYSLFWPWRHASLGCHAPGHGLCRMAYPGPLLQSVQQGVWLA